MIHTRQKIVRAAFGELEDKGLAATTKAIALRAGVNELTLFRHFETKQQLITAAINEHLRPLLEKAFNPTGDMFTDLRVIATSYAVLADTHPGVIIHILLEIHDKTLADLVIPIQKQIAKNLIGVMGTYKQAGYLADIAEEDLVREFMGPLMSRAILHKSLKTSAFEADQYVRRFIRGHTSS
jgi:AcrR family transcriptional regulator